MGFTGSRSATSQIPGHALASPSAARNDDIEREEWVKVVKNIKTNPPIVIPADGRSVGHVREPGSAASLLV